ncbi:hypothetical protein P152DRAFT_159942 [Eremomyces bilateralis CBS 781.70]|uniref:Uncharacterized protein n=1 Tax=Eremomyces bilateralis CBS 781.70 TaxID=1392243 RepID=A0A6G1FUV9_9PEZI|nr:uncharacterized protein P152DRAFT_159942 [Eremomyces bilateralis CBS 781.70]KAF1809543.1 hypothetical protein P152DRAFT_159942 [Eremomyces bilateralis CBS 781.70]
MIIHLESGPCESKIDIYNLNETAATWFQWKAYVDEEYQDVLLHHREVQSEYSEEVYPFWCPECDTGFTKLSGLFQYVCSKACNQDLYEDKMGKLIRWLEKEHSASGRE